MDNDQVPEIEVAAEPVAEVVTFDKNVTGLSLKDLIDAGLHFGHQTRRWNPKMRRYIFDKRNGIHIIDLTQSIVKINEAAAFLRDVVLSGKKVLFVATKKQAQEVVKNAALSCGQFYMTERWLGGTLTNNQTIRRSIKRMRLLQKYARDNNGELSKFKKEASTLRRELDKLESNLSGIADMYEMPGAVVVIDVCRENIAVDEANRLGIPVVAVVDTNADPDNIDYVIPGNDDAIRAIKLIADSFAGVLKSAHDEWLRIDADRQARAASQRAAEGEERGERRGRGDRRGDRRGRDDRRGPRRERTAPAAPAAAEAPVAEAPAASEAVVAAEAPQA